MNCEYCSPSGIQWLVKGHMINHIPFAFPLTQSLSLSLSLCSQPLTRAALPPVPTGVHKTPGARCAMVTRYLLMLEDISGMS